MQFRCGYIGTTLSYRAAPTGGRSNGMIVGRVIGWILLVAALLVLGRDLVTWLDTGSFAPSAAGTLWFELSPSTLELAQPAIQRHVAAWLWDPIVTVLTWPAALILGVPGLALAWLCRPRERRRRLWR